MPRDTGLPTFKLEAGVSLAQAAPLRRAWAPYRARGPPGLPATA